MVEKLELAKPEQQLSKIGSDVAKFSNAINDKKISQASYDEITNTLKFIMAKIGLREQNFPTQIEKNVIIDFIITNYSGHTLSEFILAFDMAIKGELEVDARHYESFSCIYIASIIKAYRIWAIDQHKQLPPKKYLQLEYKKELTKQDYEDWLNETKESFLAKKMDFNILPISIYEYLNTLNSFTNEQKKEAFEQAKKTRLSLLKTELINTVGKDLLVKSSIEYIETNNKSTSHHEYSSLVNFAKRLMMVGWFKK